MPRVMSFSYDDLHSQALGCSPLGSGPILGVRLSWHRDRPVGQNSSEASPQTDEWARQGSMPRAETSEGALPLASDPLGDILGCDPREELSCPTSQRCIRDQVTSQVRCL